MRRRAEARPGSASSALSPATLPLDGLISTTPNAAADPQAAGASGAAPGAGGVPAGANVIYDRMDQGPAPVVLHSGVQHVSVGIQDQNLGWVEIQTQNTGGHVDAMLVASTGQSHDALAQQLPALSQFLEQREVRVGTLGVQPPPQNSGGSFAGGTGSGTGSGAGSGTGAGKGFGTGSGTGYAGDSGAGRRGRGNGGPDARDSGAGLRSIGPRRGRGPAIGSESGAGTLAGRAIGNDPGQETTPYRPLSYISVRA